MKPPKVIYVGPYDYEVHMRKRIDVLGEAHIDEGDIDLKVEQSPASLRTTLLHELMHVIIVQSGMRKAMQMDMQAEEQVIRTLEAWLIQLLQDNPELVTFLTTTERNG